MHDCADCGSNNYLWEDGLLYRKWQPDANSEEVLQLVLPRKYRETVLKVAHSIPLAGHLGRKKTTSRIPAFLLAWNTSGCREPLQMLPGMPKDCQTQASQSTLDSTPSSGRTFPPDSDGHCGPSSMLKSWPQVHLDTV